MCQSRRGVMERGQVLMSFTQKTSDGDWERSSPLLLEFPSETCLNHIVFCKCCPSTPLRKPGDKNRTHFCASSSPTSNDLERLGETFSVPLTPPLLCSPAIGNVAWGFLSSCQTVVISGWVPSITTHLQSCY